MSAIIIEENNIHEGEGSMRQKKDELSVGDKSIGVRGSMEQ
jgi:hypothetical protein